MPGEQQSNQNPVPTLNAQTEKPLHYSYLKELRVEPCPLFKQHQCQQHRPYTCFYWHFANQRRRRPIRRRDGTFNYSPDIYCTSYDENTGTCANGGDECPFLHRVAGDVERKYHLRYYKTAMCVYPTDAKGICVKNGVHCAFAHCADDLRLPIYDIRELQQIANDQSVEKTVALLENKEKSSFVVEDSVWLDQEHVLSCYKTESCKKPPRLCRQGYACPFYHNGKDKRRPPGVFKYRSTPCPNARNADEWVDPDGCEGGDDCPYCHTRTEQQFHPEIYKSTKCNDMLQHGYCPRGPFCAFAHTDQEMHTERQVRLPPTAIETAEKAAAAYQQQMAFENAAGDTTATTMIGGGQHLIDIPEAPCPPLQQQHDAGGGNFATPAPSYSAVLKQRQQSGGKPSSCAMAAANCLANQSSGPLSSSYPKAPGFERSQQSPTRPWTPDMSGASAAGGRLRTTSLTMHPSAHFVDLGYTIGGAKTGSTDGMSPLAMGGTPPTSGIGGFLPFSPQSPSAKNVLEQQAAMIGHRAGGGSGHSNDDISLDELTLLAPIAEREENNSGGGALLQSSFGGSFEFNHQPSIVAGLYGSSAPVSIPRTTASVLTAAALDAIGAAAGGYALGRSDNSNAGVQELEFQLSGSFSRMKQFPMTPSSLGGGHSVSSLPTSFGVDNGVLVTELQRTKEELGRHRQKLTAWEEGLKQARQACEAWKQEAETHRQTATAAQTDKLKMQAERDSALGQLELMKSEVIRLQQQQKMMMPPPSVANGAPTTGATALGGPMCGRCGRQKGGTNGTSGCRVCSDA